MSRTELRSKRPRSRTLLAERLESRNLLSTFTVLNVADAGPGSLRQAILSANSNPGADRIVFNNPAPDNPGFKPLSPLPEATEAVSIDGLSLPGVTGRPLVTLDGSLAGSSANGLVLMGGQSTVQGLVIQNFGGYGVVLGGGGGNLVQSNFIGVDITGEAAAPNGLGGVLVLGSSNNSIGLPVSGGGNVISGNGGDGIRVVGATPGMTESVATGNQILSNFVGLDSTGTRSLGNSGDGIHLLRASANAIGGSSFGSGNQIGGNRGNGIVIEGDATPSISSGAFNLVQGNRVGISRVDASVSLGNALDGVRISAAGNSVGGTVAGAGNVLANNGQNGVTISAPQTAVLSNSIFGNANLGIALGTGATPVPAPSLFSLTRTGEAAVISGALAAKPGASYVVQFFGNPSGEKQARSFLGSTVQTVDADGQVAYALRVPSGVPLGGLVTATVTNEAGETSELSLPQAIAPKVVDVVLAGNRKSLIVSFSLPMEATRASNPANYRVTAGRSIGIGSIVPSIDGRSVTIQLKTKIPRGRFATVTISPPGTVGLTSTSAVPLDGDGDGLVGGIYTGRVAIGTTLSYSDAAGSTVTLSLAKGGSLAVHLSAAGEAEVVQLLNVVPGRSVLSGSVKGKRGKTTIGLLTGLNGVVNTLSNSAFQILAIQS